MSILAQSIADSVKNSSWIRKMFEAGAQLKEQFGAENVYDFSLGNPDLPAPSCVGDALRELATKAGTPFAFGYMPNAGYPWARQALAKHLTQEQGIALQAEHVLLTCGAAGGLNAVFRALLNHGDQVVTLAPYFVEYSSYVANHGAVLHAVPSQTDTFAPDINALSAAITPKTRILLLNSPNNPTGVIYSKAQLEEIATLLRNKSQEYGRPIFLIADEPYRFLAFDGATVPSLLPLYSHAICVSSFSKNLSLPGVRLGYIAITPNMPEQEELMAGLTLANRILGYVNAPVIGQHIMMHALGSQVDLSIYAARRKAMARVLDESGYEYQMPAGAFYFFPKAPGGDDIAFVQKLQQERILAVPGTGFGCPGHFRLAFCVDEDVIIRSQESFSKARA